MNKKIYYLLGTALLIMAVSLFVDFSYLNRKITNGLFRIGLLNDPEEEAIAQNKEEVNGTYKTSFLFPKYKADICTTYIPRYNNTTAEQAEKYALSFNMRAEGYSENDDSYQFKDGSITLSVFKFIDLISYENAAAEGTVMNGKIDSNEKAINAALKFIQDSELTLQSYETVVNFENGTYVVTFADRLAGMVNYAFPTVVVVNGAGVVETMDYYYFDYERLSDCSVKTMKQAFYELPTDFPEQTKIDLNRCTLVYKYENSILQPAYLFEGELQGGGTFRCFVIAAVYK